MTTRPASPPLSVMAPIELGAFEIDQPLGRGGMAEVWRGVHVKERVPVAVKVVTEAAIRKPTLHASLRNEVRAMARLDHPGVVVVLDFGEITAPVEEASDGKLVRGSPYLVMELAEGGTILPLCGRMSWSRVKQVLCSLLDALGHAHARGVVHRDVKPSNVLLFGDQVKLSDFGLAVDLDPGRAARRRGGRVLGTPAYMAPEQFVANWREYGPATDLYALGCLAYALACGGPPYGRGHELTLMYELHLEAIIPPLDPRMPVPPGFDGWVSRLLEKKPSRRYQRAADALAALHELGDPAGSSIIPLVDEISVDSPASTSIVTMRADPSEIDPISKRPLELELESVPPPAPTLAFPRSWRTPEAEHRSLDLLGAGLGLYGVRAVPLVAREAERDKLWKLLRTVTKRREKRLVLLSGAAGCGKSRLAQWLCERAHEAGLATVLKAVNGPRPGQAHGLAPMVARHLRCEGLERPELTAHIERRLARISVRDDADADALSELIAPDAEDSVDRRVRFGTASERHVLIARLLRRLSKRRPVIVWIDDVQWDLDAIAFAQHLMFLEPSANFPVLMLLTARSEALAERPEAQRQLTACGAHPGARSLPVPPLPESEWPQLIEHLLRLEGSLAERVAARTKGNPLFAVQLVGHWVDNGLLEVAANGFRLRQGASVELPDGLHGVWRERIDRLLSGRSKVDGLALEIAAVLGQTVNTVEWEQACTMAGLRAPLALVEELLARRLALAGERGPAVAWSFVHGMLRESLERRAEEEQRVADHHRACAHMLRARRGQGVAERLARHLLAAGELRMALAPLRDAAQELLERGDYALAEALLVERENALEALDSDESDRNWGEGWIVRSWVAAKRGELADGHAWATRVVDHARAHGWPRLLSEGLLSRGRVERMRGDPAAAEEDLEHALRLAREAGDQRLMAETLATLARHAMHKGELDYAARCMNEGRALGEALEDRRLVAQARWSLAHLESYRQHYEAARAHNDAALDDLRSLGDRWGVARCLNTAGEIARLLGELENAEQHYRDARNMLRTMGAADGAAVCDANVGRLQAERGEYADARRRLERVEPVLIEKERRNPLAWLYVVLLLCDAGERDWANWTLHWSKAEQQIEDTGYIDLDIATVAEMAASAARDAGQPIHAERAYRLALTQWLALGRDDGVARVSSQLEALVGSA
jgi:serine/threonine protein kinase/tetratricopeptide (TPR) repeat protein